VERGLHALAGGVLGRLLVRAPEPACTCQSCALGAAQVRLTEARKRALRLEVGCLRHTLLRLELRLGHTVSRTRSAAATTSSITSEVARSTSEFSITGTPSLRARSSMYRWIRLISPKCSRYFDVGRRSLEAASRMRK